MGSFTTTVQVRFGHVDPAGIVHFPRIYDYIHEVYEELWERHVGVRYDHLIQECKLGFPLVRSTVDFRRPLRFGDRPIVRVTCFHLGRSSLGLKFVFEQEGEIALEARMTTVCTDIEKLQSRPIPPAWRAKLEELLESPSAPQASGAIAR